MKGKQGVGNEELEMRSEELGIRNCGGRLVAAFAPFCRGGPWPSRGCLRRREVCGTMQASSPTGACYNAWLRPSLPDQNIKFVRRGGIYCARRRVSEANRRAAAALRPEIPPAKPRAAAFPRLAAGPAPPFASLVKGRWPRRQARAEGLPRHEMPPPEATAAFPHHVGADSTAPAGAFRRPKTAGPALRP